MTSIQPYYRGGALGGSISRQVGRRLACIQAGTHVDIARVEARAEIDTSKVDALTAITQRGLQGAAFLTTIEMSLAETCPAAMSRLKLIGDTGNMAIAGVVVDTAHRLNSI